MKRVIKIMAILLVCFNVLQISAFAANVQSENVPMYRTYSSIGCKVISDYNKFTEIVQTFNTDNRNELLSLYDRDFFENNSIAMAEILLPQTNYHVQLIQQKTENNCITIYYTLTRVGYGACVICYDHIFCSVSKNVTRIYTVKKELDVKPNPTVKLNQNSIELKCGSETSICAETQNADEVIWSSSNNMVATVDENGTVKAVGEGSAIIKCRAINSSGSAWDTCTVAVKFTLWQKIINMLNKIFSFEFIWNKISN